MEKHKFGALIFMIMRSIYLLCGLICLTIACSEDKHNFSVEVDVNGTENHMIYLAQRNLTGTVPVDSAMPGKSGRYKLEGYTKQPDFFIVYQQPRHYINLIIHPGDHFKVLTDNASFDQNYLVEGSKDSRLVQKMVSMQTRTLEKITEISNDYENSKGARDFEKIKARVDSTYDRVVSDHREFSIRLIEENPGSLVTLMALYQQLGRNTPVFDYKRDFRYYAMVDSNLASLYPHSEAVIDLNRKVTELRDLLRLEIGSRAPDIALPDRQGHTVTLSSLRGKNVLLIFWASWSSQSLSELREFAALYAKISGEGLEYYQVSLDRTGESWLKIVDEYQIPGVHVSDLKYWDSPVVDLYHIQKLPVIYLINRKGLIMGRNISADELPGLLESIQ